jgi:hypothetical protein
VVPGWLGGSGRHLQPPRLNRESYTQRRRPDPCVLITQRGREMASRRCHGRQSGAFGYAGEGGAGTKAQRIGHDSTFSQPARPALQETRVVPGDAG